MSVVFYHYFYHYSLREGYYPYSDLLGLEGLFAYGHWGVQLFFVISGYVISLTINRSDSIFEFGVRRFARLYPPFVICSLITWIVLTVLPLKLFPASLLSFVPSITMIDPVALNLMLPFVFTSMDGAYWSIFVEIKFYLVLVVLHFNLKPFGTLVDRFLAFGVISFCSLLLLQYAGLDAVAKGIRWLFFVDGFPWFAFGLCLYSYFHDGNSASVVRLAIYALFQVILLSATDGLFASVVFSLAIPLLVYAAYKVTSVKRFLSNEKFAVVGRASYSLYLLHQFAGLTVIRWLATLTGAEGACSVLIALIVLGIFTWFAILLHKHFEVPCNRWIVSHFLPVISRRVQAS